MVDDDIITMMLNLIYFCFCEKFYYESSIHSTILTIKERSIRDPSWQNAQNPKSCLFFSLCRRVRHPFGSTLTSTMVKRPLPITTDTEANNSAKKSKEEEEMSSTASTEGAAPISTLDHFDTLMTDDLVLQVASFLPARDLLQFQCVSSKISKLDTDKIWKRHCQTRWEPWPRYRLTPEKLKEFCSSHPNLKWKDHYRRIEAEATCTRIQRCDLLDLEWYLSFALSGVRGETRSDFLRVRFTQQGL